MAQAEADQVLPDDMLANVFGRLPPCSLAASRCVRKHWCSVIDTRRLLRADLLPLRLDGFFCNSLPLLVPGPSFFARPSAARRVGSGGRLDFSNELRYLAVSDHCNGLILMGHMVINPATRQRVTLPPDPPMPPRDDDEDEVDDLPAGRLCLAYDPMVSPHDYQVVAIPYDSIIKPSPSPCTTHVFSSREWRWKEKSFVRQGQGDDYQDGDMVSTMVLDRRLSHRQAVYFRGAIYVHCQNDAVMRIALSDDKYQVVKSPAAGTKLGRYSDSYLGKSEKGVYSALLDWDDHLWPQFRVWLLDEFSGQMEWVLKTSISLRALLENYAFGIDYDTNRYAGRPWVVINYEQTQEEAPAQDDQRDDEWDFDNGIILEATDDNATAGSFCEIIFLGFHPYKEIAFLDVSGTAVSYHLNTSKVQELGILHVPPMETSFPYTACWFNLGSYPKTIS